MKKLVLVLSVILIALFSIQSCKKENNHSDFNMVDTFDTYKISKFDVNYNPKTGDFFCIYKYKRK